MRNHSRTAIVAALLALAMWRPVSAAEPVRKAESRAARPAHAVEPTPAAKLPSFEEVEQAVARHFSTRKGYQPGDLIAQSDFDAIMDELKHLGWTPAGADQMRDAVLPDKSLLIQESRSTAGRNFMRRVGHNPQGFDRLEHLSRLINGRQTVQRLIQLPEGYKFMDYMTNTPGGREMGKMLSHDPGGKDFNEPTGRIYTEEQLLKALEQSYDAHAAELGSNHGLTPGARHDTSGKRLSAGGRSPGS
jgi:hypothetical protein